MTTLFVMHQIRTLRNELNYLRRQMHEEPLLGVGIDECWEACEDSLKDAEHNLDSAGACMNACWDI